MDDRYPIREAFQMYYLTYRDHYTVTPEQESAARCIMGCKTGDYGFTVSTCPECGKIRIHTASCGNRNCPSCQGTKPEEWVQARSSELVEGLPYFHIIMTLPHELNPLCLSNPAPMYRLLMQSANDALMELSSREENLGAVPGVVSVLHTWGQTLELHPHVHMLVSGGGLVNPSRFNRIRDSHFFCPQGQLSGCFRQHFLAGLKALREQGRLAYAGTASGLKNHFGWQELLTSLYRMHWNVFVKETFNGNGNAISYLSRYAYRTAISNSRILKVDGRGVTIRWKDYKNGGNQKEMFLTGEEFIRRFLMHVLPKGFSRIRYGGYLSNSRKKKCLSQIRRLTGTAERKNILAGLKAAERIRILFHMDILKCPCCSSRMNMRRMPMLC